MQRQAANLIHVMLQSVLERASWSTENNEALIWDHKEFFFDDFSAEHGKCYKTKTAGSEIQIKFYF